MARLDVCNFCNGNGYIHFYGTLADPGGDDEARSCPLCHGRGQVEAWRQVATGAHLQSGWSSQLSTRELNDTIRAIIRQRENG